MTVVINGTSGITDVNGTAAAPAITGTDTDTGVFFGTNTVSLSTGGTERLQVDSSGNLGLGVTPLNAYTGSGFKAYELPKANIYSFDLGSRPIAGFSVNSYLNSSAVAKYIATGYATLYESDQGQHRFYTAASGTAGNAITFTQAMTLDASGNLGVGQTSPAARLHLKGAFSTDNAFFMESTSGTGHSWAFYAPGTNSDSFAIRDVTASANRLIIDSSGNLLVGVTSGAYTTVSKNNPGSYSMTISNPNYGAGDGCLIVQCGNGTSGPYIINCQSSSASVFRVYGNGTYGTVSDLNLKKNVETARNYLPDLMQLRVVKYNWNTQEDGDAKELGFIAQEVEQVFPGLVETSDREGEMPNKMIKQPVLIPMLVKAIQEQQAIITQLQADVAALKGQA